MQTINIHDVSNIEVLPVTIGKECNWQTIEVCSGSSITQINLFLDRSIESKWELFTLQQKKQN